MCQLLLNMLSKTLQERDGLKKESADSIIKKETDRSLKEQDKLLLLDPKQVQKGLTKTLNKMIKRLRDKQIKAKDFTRISPDIFNADNIRLRERHEAPQFPHL